MIANIIGEESTNKLLSMAWEAGRLIPLVLFLDRLGSKSNYSRAKLSEMDKTLAMIDFLAKPLKKDFDVNRMRVRANFLG